MNKQAILEEQIEEILMKHNDGYTSQLVRELLSIFSKMCEEVIGDQERLSTPEDHVGSTQLDWWEVRAKLRAEQRANLKELIGKDS